ncbi:MAG: hypothetical protein ACXV2D_03615 [Halobacteriota archaeon]
MYVWPDVCAPVGEVIERLVEGGAGLWVGKRLYAEVRGRIVAR